MISGFLTPREPLFINLDMQSYIKHMTNMDHVWKICCFVNMGIYFLNILESMRSLQVPIPQHIRNYLLKTVTSQHFAHFASQWDDPKDPCHNEGMLA